jgi:hypothetical protein
MREARRGRQEVGAILVTLSAAAVAFAATVARSAAEQAAAMQATQDARCLRSPEFVACP